MTNRDFLTAVKDGKLTPETIAFAAAAIDKMDKRNSDRKSKPSKTAIANEPIKTAIVEFLNKEGFVATAADIGVNLGISTNKASSLCVQLRAANLIGSREVKIPKKGKCLAYFIVPKAEE